MLSRPELRRKAKGILERQGIVLAGILIFAYYLWAAIDLFSSPYPRRGFQGYFFQFSSVILLWGLLYLGSRLYEYKKKQRLEHEKNQRIVQEYERRKMQLEVLDEVSAILYDTVNNPLTIISISSSSIRERFAPDSEILAYVDSIDGALKRVRDVLANFEAYQTKKIMRSVQDISSQPATGSQSLAVDSSGDIRGS